MKYLTARGTAGDAVFVEALCVLNQGSGGVCCRRKTWVVGPPSELLNCFAAVKLRIQWPGAASPAARAGRFLCSRARWPRPAGGAGGNSFCIADSVTHS